MDILSVKGEGTKAIEERDDAVVVLQRAGSSDGIVSCVHRIGVNRSDILVVSEERSLLHIEELLQSIDPFGVLIALQEPRSPIEELEVVIV